MALPMTTYTTLVALERYLARTKAPTVPAQLAIFDARLRAAEATSFRKVRSWLLNHIEEPDDLQENRTPQDLLLELDTFWDANAVDDWVEDWAYSIAVVEFRSLQGSYDGSKQASRRVREEKVFQSSKRHALVTRGYLPLETGDDPDGERVILKRFEVF